MQLPNRWGVKPRLGSLWLGAHWSALNKRLCINILPCVTLWLVWPGGRGPNDPLPGGSYEAGYVAGHAAASLANIKRVIP